MDIFRNDSTGSNINDILLDYDKDDTTNLLVTSPPKFIPNFPDSRNKLLLGDAYYKGDFSGDLDPFSQDSPGCLVGPNHPIYNKRDDKNVTPRYDPIVPPKINTFDKNDKNVGEPDPDHMRIPE